MNMINMSIVPPLTTARINPTVSLDDKPIESDSTSPIVRERENRQLKSSQILPFLGLEKDYS